MKSRGGRKRSLPEAEDGDQQEPSPADALAAERARGDALAAEVEALKAQLCVPLRDATILAARRAPRDARCSRGGRCSRLLPALRVRPDARPAARGKRIGCTRQLQKALRPSPSFTWLWTRSRKGSPSQTCPSRTRR